MAVRSIAVELTGALGVRVPSEVTGKYRAGDVRHCFADISAAAQLLGYQPRVGLKQGIEELAAWLETQWAEDRVDEAMDRLSLHGLVA